MSRCRVQSNFANSRLTLRMILRSPELHCESLPGIRKVCREDCRCPVAGEWEIADRWVVLAGTTTRSAPPGSGLQQGLDGAALVHRLIALGDLGERHGEVEHLAWVDLALPD